MHRTLIYVILLVLLVLVLPASLSAQTLPCTAINSSEGYSIAWCDQDGQILITTPEGGSFPISTTEWTLVEPTGSAMGRLSEYGAEFFVQFVDYPDAYQLRINYVSQQGSGSLEWEFVIEPNTALAVVNDGFEEFYCLAIMSETDPLAWTVVVETRGWPTDEGGCDSIALEGNEQLGSNFTMEVIGGD